MSVNRLPLQVFNTHSSKVNPLIRDTVPLPYTLCNTLPVPLPRHIFLYISDMYTALSG